jgi:hypothetical protein
MAIKDGLNVGAKHFHIYSLALYLDLAENASPLRHNAIFILVGKLLNPQSLA